MRERAGCGGEGKKWMREENVRYQLLEEKIKGKKARKFKKKKKIYPKNCAYKLTVTVSQ